MIDRNGGLLGWTNLHTYRVFGNERYKSFSLLHRLEIVPRPKTCGKSLLYIGHFDIPWSQSIQMIF